MDSATLSTLAETQPLEPLLEHETRLCAFDPYEQRGRMDGHSLEDWLHAEAEILGKTSLAAPEEQLLFGQRLMPAMSRLAGLLIRRARDGTVPLFHEAGVFQRRFAMHAAD